MTEAPARVSQTRDSEVAETGRSGSWCQESETTTLDPPT